MDIKEFYDDCEYDIRVYKTKKMKNSKQIITGNSKIGILAGIGSLLQSTLDANLLTENELKDLVKMVLEARKNGARNRVIYNILKKNKIF